METPILDVKNLSIAYDADKPVVKGVSFSLKEGEVLAIVGETGSGKTTVIRSINGCLPPKAKMMSGDLRFGNESLLHLPSRQWSEIRGRQISMIFQDTGSMLNPIRTVESQFSEFLMCHETISKEEAFQKMEEALHMVLLDDAKHILKRYPFELSGGQRQRLGIAMAMVYKPKLLLADEPTSALDVTTQAQIVKELKALVKQNQTSIIIVTHNITVAASLAHKIMVMRKGVVEEYDETAAVLRNPCSTYTRQLLQSIPVLGGKPYEPK